MKKLFLAALLALASLSANAVNYFSWDEETTTMTVTSGAITPVYAGGGVRNTTQAHSPTHSMSTLNSVGDDKPSGINASSSPPLTVNYSWAPLNGRSLYYRWWMWISTDFDWSNGAKKKVKIARAGISNTGAPGGGLIYTGYMSASGFDLSEGYWAGTDSAIISGGDHFAQVNVPGGMISYADGAWHEYIIRVKPNTTATSYNGEFQVYIDGQSIGSYNAYLLVSNLPNDNDGTPNWVTNYGTSNLLDLWAAWMIAPYWQCNGAACTGTIYVDDWSVDDVFNSTFSSGGTPPAKYLPIRLR